MHNVRPGIYNMVPRAQDIYCVNKVKIRISYLVFLLFFSYIPSVWAEQWNYQFEIMKGNKYPLCRDYVANLKDYINLQPKTTPYDLSCKINVTPKYQTLFQRPTWQVIESSNYDHWFLAIAKMKSNAENKSFDQELFNAFMTEWSHGPGQRNYAMWMANFDFDFDGNKENILRLDQGGDCTDLKNSLFNKRNIFTGTFWRSLYLMTPDKNKVRPYSKKIASKSLIPHGISEYFFYHGRTFRSSWSGIFEKSGLLNSKDLYNEKAGQPLSAFVKIYGPQRYKNRTNDNPDDDTIVHISMCTIKIFFKIMEQTND